MISQNASEATLRTQTDKMMTDRYGWVPTQTDTTKSDRNMADRYRCGLDSKTQTDRKMADGYRCGPENSITQT